MSRRRWCRRSVGPRTLRPDASRTASIGVRLIRTRQQPSMRTGQRSSICTGQQLKPETRRSLSRPCCGPHQAFNLCRCPPGQRLTPARDVESEHMPSSLLLCPTPSQAKVIIHPRQQYVDLWQPTYFENHSMNREEKNLTQPRRPRAAGTLLDLVDSTPIDEKLNSPETPARCGHSPRPR